MPDTYGAKQVARKLDTTARDLRKFLRSKGSGWDAVGQGSRYEFAEAELPALARAYRAWKRGATPPAQPASTPRPARGKKTKPVELVVGLSDEELGIDPDEPLPEELDAIEEEELELDLDDI